MMQLVLDGVGRDLLRCSRSAVLMGSLVRLVVGTKEEGGDGPEEHDWPGVGRFRGVGPLKAGRVELLVPVVVGAG